MIPTRTTNYEHRIHYATRATVDIAFPRCGGHPVPDRGGVGSIHHLRRRLHFLSGKEHQRTEPARCARTSDRWYDMPAFEQLHRISRGRRPAEEPGSPVLALAGCDRIAGQHLSRGYGSRMVPAYLQGWAYHPHKSFWNYFLLTGRSARDA